MFGYQIWFTRTKAFQPKYTTEEYILVKSNAASQANNRLYTLQPNCWNSRIILTTLLNMSELSSLWLWARWLLAIQGRVSSQEKEFSFSSLVTNDLVSFCWLFSIKEKIKATFGKSTKVYFCQDKVNIAFSFKKRANPSFLYKQIKSVQILSDF